jgi:hypothetical protein
MICNSSDSARPSLSSEERGAADDMTLILFIKIENATVKKRINELSKLNAYQD